MSCSRTAPCLGPGLCTACLALVAAGLEVKKFGGQVDEATARQAMKGRRYHTLACWILSIVDGEMKEIEEENRRLDSSRGT